MTDKLLTYRYPRTMAEAASRYPCNGKEAVAVHGPYRRPLVADNWIAGLIVVASLAGLAVGSVIGIGTDGNGAHLCHLASETRMQRPPFDDSPVQCLDWIADDVLAQALSRGDR